MKHTCETSTLGNYVALGQALIWGLYPDEVNKFVHASSGIRTGASSERLLEFDARSNPLGHHGRSKIITLFGQQILTKSEVHCSLVWYFPESIFLLKLNKNRAM